MESSIVKRLFIAVPTFKSIFEESYYSLPYVIFGELGAQIRDNIVEGNNDSEFIKSVFYFFNELSSENDPKIDRLLVVGIYEGLYSSKGCNDTARHFLSGRGKDLYEYWMINGNIKALY